MVCVQCAPVSAPGTLQRPPSGADHPFADTELNPAQAYAGEVLAYMMLTVLGDAGDVENRPAWKARGLEVHLDFAAIAATMNQPDRDKSRLLVMDPSILGLSQVLYHYEKKLNLFKGSQPFDSIYPSVEMIALRLLLLQKRARGERADIRQILRREALMFDPNATPTAADMAATHLTASEIGLLQAAFASERLLFRYLKHPFLIDALAAHGFIVIDDFVRETAAHAHYRPYSPPVPEVATLQPAVTVTLLPSLLANFEPDPENPGRLAPDAEYRRVMASFREMILAETANRIRQATTADGDGTTPAAGRSPGELLRHVRFVHEFSRPFVIHPQNADAAIADLCPDADVAVIVLGKNVDRAIHFADGNPAQNTPPRLFLDLLDVKYDQVNQEIEQIGAWIVSRMQAMGLM